MNNLFVLLLFLSAFGFSQNLEEDIYVAAETFITNKNETSLNTLNQQEAQFKKQIKTKDEQLALVFLQCHKGYYLNSTSKLKEAITIFEDALQRFNEHELSTISDFDIIESCMKPLGNLYTKTGDYTNAESTIKQYIFLAEKTNNSKHQISGAINLAKLYQTLGRHLTVIKLTSDYAEKPNCTKLQKQKLIKINIDSQIALGQISSYEDVPIPLDSEKKYRIALQDKTYESALEWFKKVKAERFSNNKLSARYKSKLYLEEAQLYMLLDKKRMALKSLQAALKTLISDFNGSLPPSKSNLYAENTFIDIFDLYAEIETKPENALQYFDLSFYVSQLLRKNWTSQETKILNQTADRVRSEKCIDILFGNFKKTNNKSYVFKALQYAENSKASSLRDMFLKKLRLKKFPNDALLQTEFNLLKKQEHITSLLVKEHLGDTRVSKINQYNKQLSDVSLELKRLKQNISEQYSTDQNYFSLEDLQQKLKKDQATLVEYFYGKNNIYQFIVSQDKIDLNRIPKTPSVEKEILDFISLFYNSSIINNNISSFTKQAFGIYSLLNFKAINSNKNVMIIADGFLNFIPFEALLTQETSASSFSKMPFLVFSQNISYNSSITMYLNNKNSLNGNTVLGFFPVFEGSEQALNFSKNEANIIKDEMSADILMNTNASKQNFIEKSNDYNILHLSTHARPAALSFYDSDIFINELYSLDLNANLAVLSACDTGLGNFYKDEGPMSIARGFQYAGVQNLLFSLWQINDLSTSQIMKSFYKNFSENQSVFIANTQSKIDYLKNASISNAKKSPYYWGAFVYYGSLEPEKPNSPLFYIFFGILIVSIALFLSFKNRKNERDQVTSTISY
ncbi:CHAT domain-containing protein [Flavisericum labens]|uniref:CHAT domain-containing protein n=1 Tax=Flavisericum labens TaxID=3377112 RepID=UPI00387B7272